MSSYIFYFDVSNFDIMIISRFDIYVNENFTQYKNKKYLMRTIEHTFFFQQLKIAASHSKGRVRLGNAFLI